MTFPDESINKSMMSLLGQLSRKRKVADAEVDFLREQLKKIQEEGLEEYGEDQEWLELQNKFISKINQNPDLEKRIEKINELKKRDQELKQKIKEKKSEIELSLKEALNKIDEIDQEIDTLFSELN